MVCKMIKYYREENYFISVILNVIYIYIYKYLCTYLLDVSLCFSGLKNHYKHDNYNELNISMKKKKKR